MKDTTRSIGMLLCSALLAASPLGSAGAHAANVSPLKKVIVSDNAAWLNATLQVDGMHVQASYAGRYAFLNPNAAFSALSSDPAVVEAETNGSLLTLTVVKEGTATLTIEADDSIHPSIADHLQATVHKRGDITGDGTIDNADSLYIQQVVKGLVTPSPDDLARLDLNGDGKVSSADASAAMSLYLAQKKGTVPPEYHLTLSDVNDPPLAYDVAISGTAEVGGTVTGTYQYADPENEPESLSAFQWYRGTAADGSDRVAIPGATASSYTLVMDDAGLYLFVDVTPRAASGVPSGAAAASEGALVPIPDTTAPTATSFAPTSGASGFAPTSSPTILFDEAVKGVAGKKVTLFKASDDSEVASYDATDAAHVVVTGGTVELKGLPLASLTAYYITVDSGAFTDLSGNPYAGLSGAGAWSFTTLDVEAPIALQLAPQDDATSASYTDPLKITFDEPVTAVAGKKIKIRLDSNNLEIATFDVGLPFAVSLAPSLSGGTVATIVNPGLHPGTAYYVEVEAGAFIDAANNDFPGITGKTGWNFATLDDVGPAIAALTPSDDGTQVAPGATLQITYDEPIMPVSGKAITLRDETDNSILGTFDVGDATLVSVSGKTATVLAPGLLGDMKYVVQIPAGAFADSVGNPSGSVLAWNFATTDTKAPTLAGTLPADGATDVAAKAGSVLLVMFNEDVTSVDGKTITIRKASDDSVVKTLQASNARIIGGSATLDIGLPVLESGNEYYVNIEPGAFADLAGNLYAGLDDKTTWNFAVPVSIAVTPDKLPLDEATIHGMSLTVAATGGTFKSGVAASDFALNGAPIGTSIAGATRVSDSVVKLQLAQDGTDFDADIENMTITAQPGAFDSAAAPVTSNALGVTAIVESASAYISELLYVDNEQFAIELYSTANDTAYTLDVYRYVVSTGYVRKDTVITNSITANKTQHIAADTYVDFMDDVTISEFNTNTIPPATTDAHVFALVLKKNGQVVDVMGTPRDNATADEARQLVDNGNTLVRRADVIGGSNVYRSNQWLKYASFAYYGRHTQQ